MFINAVSKVGGITSTTASNDVFSQKVGDWAWQVAAPAVSNIPDIAPGGFAAAPQDAPVMRYLEDFIADIGLPTAHLYDRALENMTAKVSNPDVRAILENDIELRSYLRARRLGDVYE